MGGDYRRATAMRSRTSRISASFLFLALFLSIAPVLTARPVDRAESGWLGPSLTRIVNLIKKVTEKVEKVFTPVTNDDAAIPPRP
jgi:hypothetical protein